MTELQQRLLNIKAQLPQHVTLVAVSKYHTAENISECYEAGQRIFGESREQELRPKYESLPKDIQWHFIGHLQTNKVKYIAPYISLIHSVDSFRLLKEIDRQAEKNNRIIPCLLEIHLAKEMTKSGFCIKELKEMLDDAPSWKGLHHICIRGIMTMASHTDDESLIRQDFKKAKALFDELKTKYFADKENFNIRSYGMSGDYPIAVEEGANFVRIGSSIFEPNEEYS